MEEKIILELLGFKIMEPMALVWNWIISAGTFLAYLKIGSDSRRPVKQWRLFFLLFSVSTFFGGIGHGLYHYLGLYGKFLPWALGIVAVFFAEKGIYEFMPPEKQTLKKSLHFASVAKMTLVLVGMTFVSFSFSWAKNNSIVGLAVVVGAGGFVLSRRYPELIFLPLGVIILSMAAVVHGFDINPHLWFNRDDLSHLIMIFGLSFFFLAIRKHQLSQLG